MRLVSLSDVIANEAVDGNTLQVLRTLKVLRVRILEGQVRELAFAENDVFRMKPIGKQFEFPGTVMGNLEKMSGLHEFFNDMSCTRLDVIIGNCASTLETIYSVTLPPKTLRPTDPVLPWAQKSVRYDRLSSLNVQTVNVETAKLCPVLQQLTVR